MSQKVSFPAIVQSIATLKDGSIKVTMETPELSGDEMAKLFELRKAQGWCLFAENQLEDKDIPQEQAETGEKSPSQRLRGRLFVYYMEKYADKRGFQRWYEGVLDQIGESYLERLEGSNGKS